MGVGNFLFFFFVLGDVYVFEGGDSNNSRLVYCVGVGRLSGGVMREVICGCGVLFGE